jgi:Carboxypeptidase regulatory-like domain
MRTWHAGATLAVALMGAVAFTNGSRTTRPETAPIEGRVTDVQGGALQRAHVRITDEATGASTETLSLMNGRFLIANLASDHTYAIDVRCIGYVPFHTSGIHPTTAGAAIDNVAMEPIKPLTTMRVAVAVR